MFCSNFSFAIFSLMFFPLFPKVFTDILMIHELPKIYNKIPKYCKTLVLKIIIYQANFMPLNYIRINFIENVPERAKDSFYPRNIIFMKCSTKRVLFLLYQMLPLFSTINLVYVLEINIFGRDYLNLNNHFQKYQSPVNMQGQY